MTKEQQLPDRMPVSFKYSKWGTRYSQCHPGTRDCDSDRNKKYIWQQRKSVRSQVKEDTRRILEQQI